MSSSHFTVFMPLKPLVTTTSTATTRSARLIQSLKGPDLQERRARPPPSDDYEVSLVNFAQRKFLFDVHKFLLKVADHSSKSIDDYHGDPEPSNDVAMAAFFSTKTAIPTTTFTDNAMLRHCDAAPVFDPIWLRFVSLLLSITVVFLFLPCRCLRGLVQLISVAQSASASVFFNVGTVASMIIRKLLVDRPVLVSPPSVAFPGCNLLSWILSERNSYVTIAPHVHPNCAHEKATAPAQVESSTVMAMGLKIPIPSPFRCWLAILTSYVSTNLALSNARTALSSSDIFTCSATNSSQCTHSAPPPLSLLSWKSLFHTNYLPRDVLICYLWLSAIAGLLMIAVRVCSHSLLSNFRVPMPSSCVREKCSRLFAGSTSVKQLRQLPHVASIPFSGCC